MNKASITLTLKGTGLSYEKEIDENTAAQIMALCLTLHESRLNTEKTGQLPSFQRILSSSQSESAAEYLNRYAPRRNPDKILALAGFLKMHHNKESFEQGEIKSLFRDAGELTPANLTRDFKATVAKGWIAPEPNKKGSFYITNTGIKALEGGFPEESVVKRKAPRRKNKG